MDTATKHSEFLVQMDRLQIVLDHVNDGGDYILDDIINAARELVRVAEELKDATE